MWPAQTRASCFRAEMYEIKRDSVFKRNMHIVEWSLVATRDIPIGTFLGFYSGEFDLSIRNSLYAAKLDNFHIYPFPDEDNISEEQRSQRPFANMNEPNIHEFANCCMIVQDFAHTEIENVSYIPNFEAARFFRGLACLSCAEIKSGESLTWHMDHLTSHTANSNIMLQEGSVRKLLIKKCLFQATLRECFR